MRKVCSIGRLVTILEWPLLAESSLSTSLNIGKRNVRFREKLPLNKKAVTRASLNLSRRP
jgi:hypothetical protein